MARTKGSTIFRPFASVWKLADVLQAFSGFVRKRLLCVLSVLAPVLELEAGYFLQPPGM